MYRGGGHCCASMAVRVPFADGVCWLLQVVCCQGGQSTGYTHFIPSEEQLETRIVTRAYMEAKMVVALAGRQVPCAWLLPVHTLDTKDNRPTCLVVSG